MVIKEKEIQKPNNRVRSRRTKMQINISLQGMIHTRKGVQELGSGWLFISPVNVWKSKNLLRLAYRKSMINKAEIHSRSTCLLNIVQLV